MTEIHKTYLPAAGRDWALPLYDPLVKLLRGDAARKALLDQASIGSNDRVLDIGCGTGTFAASIKSLHSDVEVAGLDPDPKALARARQKAARAAVSIQFDQGFSDEMPYRDRSFDRVFSTFMFHHLRADQKEKTLREVWRVLAPGGSFHMLDFAPADGWRAHFAHSKRLSDNSERRILKLMSEAGFANSNRVGMAALFFGFLRIAYYKGVA